MILDKLIKIPVRRPFLVTLASKVNVGKTTLKSIIASDELKQGNNVLYLAIGEQTNTIIEKVDKALNGAFNIGTLYVVDINPSDDIMKRVKELVSDKNLSMIIFDGFQIFNKDVISQIIVLLKAQNISVVISTQLSHKFSMAEPTWLGLINHNFVLISDLVCVLESKELTLDDKIKYFFMFWKTKPNRTFRVVKNRYGNESITDIHIDFKNVKIKK